MVVNPTIEKLITLLSRVPGIGPKSAERIVYFLLQADSEYIKELSESIGILKLKIKNCKICGNYTESEICEICSNPLRDKSKICVVEEPQDLIAIEKLNIYNGVYHILFGVISPINGIGPEDLNIKSLVARVKDPQWNVTEIILATNPTPEGDTTAYYITKILKNMKVKFTKLSPGIPVGAHIDYTDPMTLTRSFINRTEINFDS